jgi:threonine synthase
MKFCSTRDAGLRLPLAQALFSPRAPDGGVFMPCEDVDLRNYFYLMDESMSFEDMVRSLAAEVLKDEAKPDLVEALAGAAARLNPRLTPLGDDITMLELYHGPTAAFQDYALSFLAVLMERMRPAGRRVKILIPTGGDTGAAAAEAFADRDGFDVVLLCPEGASLGIPAARRVGVGGNTRVIAVRADRQAVQSLASALLSSKEDVERLGLSTATTLNPGRFITQAFHYIYAFIQLKRRAGDMYFDIPSGNHGNFTSGILAWRWGMPVTGFIAASWREPSDCVRRAGRASAGGMAVKSSTSMAQEKEGAPAFSDVVNPDHYERMTCLASGNPLVLRSIIHSAIVSGEAAREAVKRAYADHAVFLAPPTAVGYAAALAARGDFLEETGKIILLGTSHPSKHADEIERLTGRRPDRPARGAGIGEDSEPDAIIGPEPQELRRILDGF